MTYRGVYRDGYVRLEGDNDLQDGARVEVSLEPDSRLPRTAAERLRAAAEGKAAAALLKRLTSKRMTKAQRLAALDAAFGMYKDRPDWKGKSTVQIAAELRVRASRRGRHG